MGLVLGACGEEPAGPDPGNNLVLVTFDGIRQREMFGMPDPTLPGTEAAPAFPMLHASLEVDGVMYGDTTKFDSMTTANSAQLSIPGYMSIFVGYEQRQCGDNDCPPVTVETVLEYVQRRRDFARGEVAVFASWEKIGRAIEQLPGNVFADIGAHDGEPGIPGIAGRLDEYTVARAMTYLETHRPRLLYIALLDGDAWGHKGDYGQHLAALHRYDAWTAELRAKLATMGDYGARTTMIVTTDHGRGDADLWTNHNSQLPGSDHVWLYAVGPAVNHGILPGGVRRRSSADIRPTIEVFFGLPPSSCELCGDPLAEIVGPGS